MATILFWNICKKPLIDEIVSLCHHHDVDILILAESAMLEVEILEALNTGTERLYLAPLNLSEKLFFFFRYPAESIASISDEGGVAIRKISPPIGCEFLLVALHLPSKLHRTEYDQAAEARRVAELIREAEEQVGHNRTIIIGDLNMNPFEDGVVGADGFHAVMTQNIALKRSRKVANQKRLYFYNPMWGRMGDFSTTEPPGTYYYSKSGYINYFWHTFDQVLLRPDLLDFFSQEDLSVIYEIGNKSLLTQKKIINKKSFSDHLPIKIKLKIEQENKKNG
jgi:hypothetical protein